MTKREKRQQAMRKALARDEVVPFSATLRGVWRAVDVMNPDGTVGRKREWQFRAPAGLQTALDMMAGGASVTAALATAAIPRATWYQWLQVGRARPQSIYGRLVREFERTKYGARVAAAMKLYNKAVVEGDIKALQTWLRANDPQYAPKVAFDVAQPEEDGSSPTASAGPRRIRLEVVVGEPPPDQDKT